MDALSSLEKIFDTELVSSDLKCCLVSNDKKPFKIDGTLARPNLGEDFVGLTDLLQCSLLDSYAGVGISIQASNVCAIDVDKCFSIPNDVTSIDERGKYILDLFKEVAYCEFSFSGTGLRVIFKAPIIEDYSKKYYIKNERYKIEYYQPTKSFRYVTITGNYLYNNSIKEISIDEFLIPFLEKYMKRDIKPIKHIEILDDKPIEVLMNRVKYFYLTDHIFQELWFGKAPGSGKNESELDYQLISLLFETITQNKEKLKIIFESSPYFKSKDSKHIYKWNYQNCRYYEYIYDSIRRTH